jgi:hypothetical protein
MISNNQYSIGDRFVDIEKNMLNEVSNRISDTMDYTLVNTIFLSDKDIFSDKATLVIFLIHMLDNEVSYDFSTKYESSINILHSRRDNKNIPQWAETFLKKYYEFNSSDKEGIMAFLVDEFSLPNMDNIDLV